MMEKGGTGGTLLEIDENIIRKKLVLEVRIKQKTSTICRHARVI